MAAALEREKAQKFMYELLRLMIARKASDLFITAGFPPAMKIDGKLTPVNNQSLTAQHTAELARAIMSDKQAAEFESSKVEFPWGFQADDRCVSRVVSLHRLGCDHSR